MLMSIIRLITWPTLARASGRLVAAADAALPTKLLSGSPSWREVDGD